MVLQGFDVYDRVPGPITRYISTAFYKYRYLFLGNDPDPDPV